MVTIDNLEIEIQDNSQKAIDGLDALATSLSRLKTATTGGAGLSKVTKLLSSLSSTLNGFSGGSTSKLQSLSTTLSTLGKVKFSSSTANQINKLSASLKALDTSSIGKVSTIATGLKPLEEMGKTTNFRSVITQLNKLPATINGLKHADLDTFTKDIQRLAISMKPLADEMAKVSAGFSAFPSRIQRLITQNERLSTSNIKVGKSYTGFNFGLTDAQARLGIAYIATRQIANVMSDWVMESTGYVENLNLFTVAMGKYTDESLAYAKQVQDAMGIDMSQWIRNQGIFKQIGSAFGMVEEQAYNMSRGLTQVSYDISSFFNIPIDEAFLKVQSGISGELEPLRRLGYALDQATLQQIAYDNGITMSITKMTQAQKAELRYIAIMKQSTNVVGDMSRTLITPANAMRILNQQITQLKRALGDMLIPILMQVIPWVQAFVQVFTDAARAIAAMSGFELPKIDYSGLNGMSSGAESAADAMDDATNSAKELKNATLGFDELNVISPQEPTGGNAGTGAGGSGLGLDLKSYDFMKGLREQTDKYKKAIKDMLPYVVAIGVAFTTWKIGKEVLDLIGGKGSKSGLINLATQIGNVGRALWGIAAGSAAVKSALKFLTGGETILALAGITGVVAIVAGRLVDLWNNSETFRRGVQRLGEVALGVFGVIKDLLSPIGDLILWVGQKIANLIPDDIRLDIANFFKQFNLDWKDLGISALGFALLFIPGGQVSGGILLGFELITIGIRTLGTVSQETWEAIKKWFSDGVEWVKSKLSDTFTNYIQPWFTKEKWMTILEGAKQGITTKVDETLVWWRDTVATWWDENVAPWFTIERWLALVDGAKTGIVNKFTETINWWKLAISGWWINDVSPWFTITKWTTLFDGAKLGITNKWDETVAWWKGALSDWWNTHVAPWFTYTKWLDITQGIKAGLIQSFKNAIEGARELFNKFIDWLNSKMRFSWGALEVAGKTLVEAGSIQLFTIPRIPPLFADGGFPDPGQMFIAREAGPEMIGSIGGRTAVANNDQIVEAVSQGVYQAVKSAMSSSSEQPLEVKVYLDGKEITRSVEKVQRERGVSISTGGVLVG